MMSNFETQESEVNNLDIKIRYLETGLVEIKVTEIGDWIDLRSAETVCLYKGEKALLRLGVAMKLPDGYEAILAPRSSTFKNYGIIQTNGIGIIDSTYCGNNDEWMMPVLATREIMIHKNDRICQFRIQKKQPTIKFVVVDKLGDEDRGGFGSTGTN